MGSSFPGGEMCMEGSRPAGRRGAKKQAAAEHKANRQPQRGLGVAQLEKIRLHNQMMAAYRSAGGGLHPAATAAQQAPFAAPVPAGASSFQPYFTNCFEETERGIVPVRVQQYYDGHHHLPYGSSPPPPSLFAHGVRDSSGHRLGQPPLQQYCLMSSASDGSRSSHGSAEELDLELRL
ncbi:hypothetical protein PAHAL_5G533600 [Panicum hallii]|uniref:Uncharacterized protein n=1 Tax=Panicum hallii TaxID=206008 RepID=A0A2S3HZC9_9POAL|nr:protein SPEAR1-like [Panicum hallii]PAN33098.1 hypothetical protein PAHAL_5G533600 [Panicum hallii]